MIVKNEENTLPRCLKSVRDLFDEIIIVDTGSTDKTKKNASNFTNKIYDFKWINDFSAARNYAFSKATKEYVMWLDADDIIKKTDYQKLKKIKKNLDKKIDIVMLKYNTSFDSNGNPNFSFYRERILKREKRYQWQDPVHEYISMSGNIIKEDIAITHKSAKKEISTRNLDIYSKMKESKVKFTPRNLYYYGRELNDHGKTKEAIKILKQFLRTNEGWLEDNISACIIIYHSYLKINKEQSAIEYLYKTFNYDAPRPKPATLIGDYFQSKKKYRQAIYWYQQAIINQNLGTDGFYEKDYGEFIPLINLVVCYDKIGEKEIAKQYHEVTKNTKPNHPSVIFNEKYFNEIKN